LGHFEHGLAPGCPRRCHCAGAGCADHRLRPASTESARSATTHDIDDVNEVDEADASSGDLVDWGSRDTAATGRNLPWTGGVLVAAVVGMSQHPLLVVRDEQ